MLRARECRPEVLRSSFYCHAATARTPPNRAAYSSSYADGARPCGPPASRTGGSNGRPAQLSSPLVSKMFFERRLATSSTIDRIRALRSSPGGPTRNGSSSFLHRPLSCQTSCAPRSCPASSSLPSSWSKTNDQLARASRPFDVRAARQLGGSPISSRTSSPSSFAPGHESVPKLLVPLLRRDEQDHPFPVLGELAQVACWLVSG